MKKKITLILALMLIFALALSACGTGKTTTTGSNPPVSGGATDTGAKTYTLGVTKWGAGVPILDSFGDAAQYTLGVLGQKTTLAADDFTADKELSNVRNFISQGVDGIVLQASATSTLPQIAKATLEAKMPLVLYVSIGTDDDRAKIISENQYFVGAVDADMYEDGQFCGKYALEDGCKTAIMIGGNRGDNDIELRFAGFKNAFEAGGGVVYESVYCTDNSECATKAEDALSAHRDADAFYACVGDYAAGTLSAIDNLGVADHIKVYLSCTDADSAQKIKEGRIRAGNDGISLSAYIAPQMLVNYLDGHQILDGDGKAPHFRTHAFKIDQSNVDDYLNAFCTPGKFVVPEELVKTLSYRYNPDVSYQTFVDFINNLSLDTILKAQGIK